MSFPPLPCITLTSFSFSPHPLQVPSSFYLLPLQLINSDHPPSPRKLHFKAPKHHPLYTPPPATFHQCLSRRSLSLHCLMSCRMTILRLWGSSDRCQTLRRDQFCRGRARGRNRTYSQAQMLVGALDRPLCRSQFRFGCSFYRCFYRRQGTCTCGRSPA